MDAVLIIGGLSLAGILLYLASRQQQNGALAPLPPSGGGETVSPGVNAGTSVTGASASLFDDFLSFFSQPETSPPVIAATTGTPRFDSKVQTFARAIAQAEGFYVAGTVPNRAHNPGDLGPGDCGSQWPVIHAVGSDVSQLPDDATGWQYLYAKLARIFNGQSGSYNLDGTITDMAKKYAGNWQVWANNVGAYLGVNPDSVTLRQWLMM